MNMRKINQVIANVRRIVCLNPSIMDKYNLPEFRSLSIAEWWHLSICGVGGKNENKFVQYRVSCFKWQFTECVSLWIYLYGQMNDGYGNDQIKRKTIRVQKQKAQTFVLERKRNEAITKICQNNGNRTRSMWDGEKIQTKKNHKKKNKTKILCFC